MQFSYNPQQCISRSAWLMKIIIHNFTDNWTKTNNDNNSSSAPNAHTRSVQIAFIRRRHLHHNTSAVLICIRLWTIKWWLWATAFMQIFGNHPSLFWFYWRNKTDQVDVFFLIKTIHWNIIKLYTDRYYRINLIFEIKMTETLLTRTMS